MSVTIEIPTQISEALRLPPAERGERLRTELAISLYTQGILSFGKARQLAEMGKFEFGLMLGKRGLVRHLSEADLRDDLDYASSQ